MRFFPVSLASRQAIKQDLELEGRIVLALGRVAKNKGYDMLLAKVIPTGENE
jgi:mannosylfructose-phosphate synthase